MSHMTENNVLNTHITDLQSAILRYEEVLYDIPQMMDVIISED